MKLQVALLAVFLASCAPAAIVPAPVPTKLPDLTPLLCPVWDTVPQTLDSEGGSFTVTLTAWSMRPAVSKNRQQEPPRERVLAIRGVELLLEVEPVGFLESLRGANDEWVIVVYSPVSVAHLAGGPWQAVDTITVIRENGMERIYISPRLIP